MDKGERGVPAPHKNNSSNLLQQLDIMLRRYSCDIDSPGDIVWHCELIDNCTQQTNTSAHYFMTPS